MNTPETQFEVGDIPAESRVKAWPTEHTRRVAAALEAVILDKTAPAGERRFRKRDTYSHDETLLVCGYRAALLDYLGETCINDPDIAMDLLGADILEGSWHWIWASIFALAIRRRGEIPLEEEYDESLEFGEDEGGAGGGDDEFYLSLATH